MQRISILAPSFSTMTMSPQRPTPRPMARTSTIWSYDALSCSVLSGLVLATDTRLSVIL